jgi:hypothetical protein
MARPLRVGGSAVAAATTTTRDDRQHKHDNQHDNQIQRKHNDNVELSSKRDDVGHVGQTCLIESFGGVSALPCHESTN